MSLLDLLNAETKPAPIEVKPEPDPKTIALDWISVPIEPLALELGDGEAEERAAELAAAGDYVERDEILQRHRAADAWNVSVAGRLAGIGGGPVPGARHRSRTRCPCQPDATEPVEWSLIFDDEARDGRPWDAPRADPQADRFRAACLRGCSPDVIGPAIAALIRKWNADDAESAERTAAYVAEEQRRVMAASASILALRDVPAPPWVVDGVLPANSLVGMIGASGSRKTFVAMHLAICVAAGIPFHGRPVTQGRVLLVLLEGARDDHWRRIAALAAGLGVDTVSLAESLQYYPHRLQIADPASVAQLAGFVAAFKHSLIVIDNLSEIRPPGSENDNDGMGHAVRPLAQLAHGDGLGGVPLPPTTVVLAHHANAAGDPRGATAVRQHLDHELGLDASDPKRNDAVIRIVRGKARGGAGVDLAVRFEDREHDDKGRPSVIVPVAVKAQDRDEDPGEDPEDPRREELLALLPALSEDLYRGMTCGRRDAKKARDALAADGVIRQDADRVWRLAE